MPRYDEAGFSPPAPVATVTLRTLDRTSELASVMVLLDTGADVSVVPRSAAEALGLMSGPHRTFELAGFDGATSLAPAVELELIFEGRSFRGSFLVVEREWGLLGRNVLNRLPLLFDGPQLAWSVALR